MISDIEFNLTSVAGSEVALELVKKTKHETIVMMRKS